MERRRIIQDNVYIQSTCGLFFNWLVNYGVSVTFPLLIAIGYSLPVPANAVIDRFLWGVLTLAI